MASSDPMLRPFLRMERLGNNSDTSQIAFFPANTCRSSCGLVCKVARHCTSCVSGRAQLMTTRNPPIRFFLPSQPDFFFPFCCNECNLLRRMTCVIHGFWCKPCLPKQAARLHSTASETAANVAMSKSRHDFHICTHPTHFRSHVVAYSSSQHLAIRPSLHFCMACCRRGTQAKYYVAQGHGNTITSDHPPKRPQATRSTLIRSH